MIGCFPDPYPDELFYSLCARYAERVHYQTRRAIIQDLFGGGAGIGAVDLPTRLRHLVSALPPEHLLTEERLIDEHTLLPFYGPFLPPTRLLQLRKEMQSDNGRTIHGRLGVLKSSIRPPQFLRYCPDCVSEDRLQFDETYWHRVHQASGVLVCPVHGVFLEEAQGVAGARRYGEPHFVTAEQAIPPMGAGTSHSLQLVPQILLDLAQDTAWLLVQKQLCPGRRAIQICYRRLLSEQHLLQPLGTIRLRVLADRIAAAHSDEVLERLLCLPHRNHVNWLRRLLEWESASHPLYHFLLLRSLDHSAKAFFQRSIESWLPFGKPLWPCLNPICPQYRQRVILECQIPSKFLLTLRPRGSFACSCGFSYWRDGPDRSPEDHFLLHGVISYGPVWERGLRQLWVELNGAEQVIAERLQESAEVVHRQAELLGLIEPTATSLAGLLEQAAPPVPQDWGEDELLWDQFPATSIPPILEMAESARSSLCDKGAEVNGAAVSLPPDVPTTDQLSVRNVSSG